MSNTTEIMLSPEGMKGIMEFAGYMAKSGDMIPQHWRGNQGACMALLTQSMRWGMDPFAVANQAFSVSGTLGYSAQLVNSVISSSNAIKGRFHYEYSDGWDSVSGKSKIGKVTKYKKGGGSYEVDEPIAGWESKDEEGLWVRAGALIQGEEEITWGEKLYLSGVITRNSPLWVTNPAQQIAYLAIKFWARLYCPSVIMGVYTADELPSKAPEEREVSGETIRDLKTQKEPVADLDDFEFEASSEPEEAEKGPFRGKVADTDVVLQQIAKAQTKEELKELLFHAQNVKSDHLKMVQDAYNGQLMAIKENRVGESEDK